MKQQVESLILKSKLPTHKRLSSTWFDFMGSNGKGILVSGSILTSRERWTGVVESRIDQINTEKP